MLFAGVPFDFFDKTGYEQKRNQNQKKIIEKIE